MCQRRGDLGGPRQARRDSRHDRVCNRLAAGALLQSLSRATCQPRGQNLGSCRAALSRTMAGRRPISSRTLYVTGFPLRMTASDLAIDFERYVHTSHAESGRSYAATSRRPRRPPRVRMRLWNMETSATQRTHITTSMDFALARTASMSSMPRYVRAPDCLLKNKPSPVWRTGGAPRGRRSPSPRRPEKRYDDRPTEPRARDGSYGRDSRSPEPRRVEADARDSPRRDDREPSEARSATPEKPHDEKARDPDASQEPPANADDAPPVAENESH